MWCGRIDQIRFLAARLLYNYKKIANHCWKPCPLNLGTYQLSTELTKTIITKIRWIISDCTKIWYCVKLIQLPLIELAWLLESIILLDRITKQSVTTFFIQFVCSCNRVYNKWATKIKYSGNLYSNVTTTYILILFVLKPMI